MSMAAKWFPRYIPQSAKPMAEVRADPTIMGGQAAFETAMRGGKPMVQQAFEGLKRGRVPPMMMVVERRRMGM
ncbi:hypothetical protein HYALB_00013381 [Hymenoscyphus albidus]|uniref:Uncharacterized protein n=1 Tax=Hymenoscyphus albidus TaxID=595503 RepID=A0A9N9LUI1_9HELO|nr:hypothetical protein HYALB_00013381 [Hymenoscyphus albidus]